MKKKIICIGIIGMFLLISTATLSVAGTKLAVTEASDELPDLTITKTWLDQRWVDDGHGGTVKLNDPSAEIKNIGNVPVTIDLTLEIQEISSLKIGIGSEIVITNDYSKKLPLAPGESFEYHYLDHVAWINHPIPNPEVLLKKFTFTVDPNNLIEEQNEENNEATYSYFTSRDKNNKDGDSDIATQKSGGLQCSIHGGKGITFKVTAPEGYEGGEVHWSGVVARWRPFQEEEPNEHDFGRFTIEPGFPIEYTHTFYPQLNGFGSVIADLSILDENNDWNTLVAKGGFAFGGFVIFFY